MTVHDSRDERFGRYYEEFEVGDVYRHWPGRTITQAEDHLFCSLTAALSPLHVDAHYAQPRRRPKGMGGGTRSMSGAHTNLNE